MFPAHCVRNCFASNNCFATVCAVGFSPRYGEDILFGYRPDGSLYKKVDEILVLPANATGGGIINVVTPPSATKLILEMSAEERDLFTQVVSRNYQVTVATVHGVADDRRAVFFCAHTRPEAVGHVKGW